MVPVTVAKIQTQEKMGWVVTSLLLLDEHKQRVLPLWFYHIDAVVGELPVQTSLQQDLTAAALARPLTLDLLMRLLNTLGGTLEGIEIDFLQGEVLSAHVSLRDQQHNQHRVSACLNEALALAVRCSSTIQVSETVLERKGVVLAAYGTNLEQQLETIFHLLCTGSERLHLKKEPYNLDFTDGLRGWQFLGDPEQVDYRLDTTTTHTGKASLAIVLYEEPSVTTAMEKPPVSVYISHEGFLADQYRGQRLRMIAILKAEHVQLAHLHLQVGGPQVEDPRSSSGVRPGYEQEVNTLASPIVGTCDWTPYELIIDVPADADKITPYLIAEGEGKLWLDRIDFETMDNHTPNAPA